MTFSCRLCLCPCCHLFLQCVVAAELIALAGDSGIKCGGAMLRDVGVYCLAIFSVLLAFVLGQVRSCACMSWVGEYRACSIQNSYSS